MIDILHDLVYQNPGRYASIACRRVLQDLDQHCFMYILQTLVGLKLSIVSIAWFELWGNKFFLHTDCPSFLGLGHAFLGCERRREGMSRQRLIERVKVSFRCLAQNNSVISLDL